MAASPPRRPLWWAGVGALCGVWLAQVSIPLLERGHRAGPTTLVVVLLAAGVLGFAAAARGVPRALAAVAVASGVGLLVEVVGTRTGLPFGRYEYTGELRPKLAGVPVAVILAWAGMGVPAWAVACRLVRPVAARVALGAVALTGWDLFLDPQMVKEGYWVWPGGGVYRGIPASNFLGWLFVAAGLMALLQLVVPHLASAPLAATYLLMGVMETLGFAAFFGDVVVALVGGVVCVPLGIAAVAGLPRARVPTGAGAG
jgi:uncharacterized membrane protein